MFNNEQIQHLTAKLDATHVKKRSQAGRQLSYVEGWHAIAEANRIFGHSEWDRETVELAQLGRTEENDKGNKVVAYMAKVRIRVRAGDHIVVRDGCGFGSGFAKSEGDAHESAIKEAETDAMKRALMTFGNPFGLALYDKEQKEVEKSGARSSAEERPALNRKGEGSNPSASANGKKDPDEWWSGDSLAIPVKADNWQTWDGRMFAAIKAAPGFDALMKLQMDNADNLDGYFSKHVDAHKNLMAAFAKRAGDLSQEPPK